MTTQRPGTNRTFWPRVILLLCLVVVVAVGAYFGWRTYSGDTERGLKFHCDMEAVAQEGDGTFFVTNDKRRLANGQGQVEGTSRSGSHSCLLHAGQPFGATWETADIHPGDVIEAHIWRKSKDHTGFFIATGSWDYYREATTTGRQDGDWEELRIHLQVPTYAREATFKLYAWNPSAEWAYFDDLSVHVRRAAALPPQGLLSPEDSIVVLNLDVGADGLASLQAQRDAAMQRGLLDAQAKEEGWVKLKMDDGKDAYTGELRLKGDWVDHLMGEKWSFRIALDQGQAWRGMTTFSVQNPRTRYFLGEWVFHQWLAKEDVLSPRYGFVEVRVNGASRGLYAYEEHFEKQLVEYNHRPSGPILKLDEEGLWQAQDVSLQTQMDDFETHVPAYKASDIEPFGAKAARKDSTLRQQVQIAQQLAQQYKTGQKTVGDLFDPEKVARYYAIIDVLGAQHGIIWHNQRWYYNPVISKLEPIGFDGYTETGPYRWIDKPFIGFSRNIRYMAPGYRELMFERFFHDPKFLELYIGALRRFTDPAYLDQFYYEIEPALRHLEAILQKEWPSYEFDRAAFFDKASMIRQVLLPLQSVSVKAHLQGKTDRGIHYRVYNYHCLPVILQGVGKKPDKVDAPFSKDLLVDAYNQEFPAEYLDAYSKAEGKWVFFKVPGMDSLFAAEVLPWKEPTGLTPEQSLFRDLKLTSNEFYQVDEALKRVTFKTGKYRCSRDLLFPPGYQVWFEKGVELDLVQGAKCISKSQVLLFGTEDQPILITSSDRTAQGFTVLQAEGKSEFHYVAFDHLGALQDRGWNLTGAVTLYESESYFDHARFVHSHAEDALHTIRSVFTFSDSYIGYAQGDGLDADFCTGTIFNAQMFSIGGKAMDLAGSNITVSSATVDRSGGSALDMGEGCKGTIVKATLRNSKVGLAVRDLSQVTVNEIELYHDSLGISVFQSKAEHGPATLVVEKIKAEGVSHQYSVQPGSKLTVEGQEMGGQQ